MRTRVIFMGTPEFAAPCVHALADHPHLDLIAVVCQPDRRHGRHKTPQPPPVKSAAIERGVSEILQPKRIKRGAFPRRLEELAPDLIVVTAYGRILPKAILDLPKLGCVNVHASLLPRWRGAAPIQWSIADGDRETGVCLMEMEEGLDTGAVLARVTTPIAPDETGQSLHDRLSAMGAGMLAERMSALIGKELLPNPQDDSAMTYARMLTREDGRLDWTKKASELDCRIRGFYPWPGAVTMLDERPMKLFPPLDVLDDVRGVPGALVSADSEGLVIACGSGAIRVIEVQLLGKRRMPVGDFLRGFALEVGAHFS